MSECIPTAEDWYKGLMDLPDTYAYDKFFGKSLAEAIEVFRTSALGAAEAVSYMPPVPFRFYIQAFAEFLQEAPLTDGEFDLDSEYTNGAASFLELVLSKVSHEPDVVIPVMLDLLKTAVFVANNQFAFGANISIYGRFSDLVEKIKSAYEKALNNDSPQSVPEIWTSD